MFCSLCTSTFVVGGLFILAFYMFLMPSDRKLRKIFIEMTPDEKNSFDEEVKKKVVPDMPFVVDKEPNRLQCYNPATAELIGNVALMSKDEVEGKILLAKAAQMSWNKTSFSERRSVLLSLLEYYSDKQNQEEVCQICSVDSGKTMVDAMLGEIIPTCEKLRWMVANGERILKPESRYGNGLMTMHKNAVVEYKPLGVLAVLAPFNYPCHNLLNHIISGIFAGNGVVCKVSEYTSFSADFLLRPVRKALSNAGYNPDLVQVVTGLSETGEALVKSKNIDKIIFTGSDRVGKIIMRNASENLTPVVLELGGKDPFVICNDVVRSDPNWIKDIAMRGVFQNSGQNCIGIERIFLEAETYDTLIPILEKAVKQLRQKRPRYTFKPQTSGEDTDIGSLTMKGQLKHIESLVDDAVKKGAKLLCGGKINQKLAPGIFFEPTLLIDVEPNMDIFQLEVFGPVMAIIKWKDETELQNKINACNFGLGSSVFCFDKIRAKRISDGIYAGMGNINDFGVNYLCQCLPFGGVKHSGFGRFAGEEGLRACCYPKSLTSDRIPGVKTSLPKAFVYPTSENAADVASDLVGFIYKSEIQKKLTSLLNFISGLIKA